MHESLHHRRRHHYHYTLFLIRFAEILTDGKFVVTLTVLVNPTSRPVHFPPFFFIHTPVHPPLSYSFLSLLSNLSLSLLSNLSLSLFYLHLSPPLLPSLHHRLMINTALHFHVINKIIITIIFFR